jgi:hypothetical protein
MSKSKRLGTGWETAVVNWLRADFPYVERRALHGTRDKGDVSGIPSVMIECKNEAGITLAAYMDEVKVQTEHANAQIGVAWIKRRGKGVDQSYVVMSPETFVRLIK